MNNLFIVGAQRSGSTYLYHLLNEHPQIIMAQPVRPEPKFFLKENLCANDIAVYEKYYFSEKFPCTVYLGEKSTSYIEYKSVAQRIKQFYPNARILMILRDPVLRAWSNYLFSLQNGTELLSFDDALQAEPERLQDSLYTSSANPFAYIKRGNYIDYIDFYLKYFSRDQLYIIIFEEFIGNIQSVRFLYDWLGVDKQFIPPSLGKIFNESSQYKNISPDTFYKLVEHYEQSLRNLEHFLGRSIESWRNNWKLL